MSDRSNGEPPACRMVASRAPNGAWQFLLANDGPQRIDDGLLDAIETEWGDRSHRTTVRVVIPPLAAGEHALLWPDDGGDSEFRMLFHVQVRCAHRTTRLVFEFPRLYRVTQATEVPGLGRAGVAVGPTR